MNKADNCILSRTGGVGSTIVKLLWVALLFTVPSLAQSPPVFRSDVNLVRVPCIVTQRGGATVHDLRQEEFVVLEDNVPQQTQYVWHEKDLPLYVVLVNDSGCYSPDFIAQHRQTISQFVRRVLSGRDLAGIVSATDQARLVIDLTDSVEMLQYRAEQPFGDPRPGILGSPCVGTNHPFMPRLNSPCGFKALWNAVFFAATLKLRPRVGRKAVLLLTDGLDTGSDHGLREAIAACQNADAVVYSIRWAVADPNAGGMRGEYAHWRDRGKPDLEWIARDTGGLAFEGSKNNLEEIFGRIEADLRDQYVLGYVARGTKARRSYHKIRVKVTRPGTTVRAREGYYEQ